MNSPLCGKEARIERIYCRRLRNSINSTHFVDRLSLNLSTHGSCRKQGHSVLKPRLQVIPILMQGRRAQSPYTLSVPMQVHLCVRRGYQRLRGDMAVMVTGIIFNSVMAIVIGSVFYNLPNGTGSLYSRGALLFFAIVLAAFASALEVWCRSQSLQITILTWVDLDFVRSTSNRRETVQICLLPSIC